MKGVQLPHMSTDVHILGNEDTIVKEMARADRSSCLVKRVGRYYERLNYKDCCNYKVYRRTARHGSMASFTHLPSMFPQSSTSPLIIYPWTFRTTKYVGTIWINHRNTLNPVSASHSKALEYWSCLQDSFGTHHSPFDLNSIAKRCTPRIDCLHKANEPSQLIHLLGKSTNKRIHKNLECLVGKTKGEVISCVLITKLRTRCSVSDHIPPEQE